MGNCNFHDRKFFVLCGEPGGGVGNCNFHDRKFFLFVRGARWRRGEIAIFMIASFSFNTGSHVVAWEI